MYIYIISAYKAGGSLTYAYQHKTIVLVFPVGKDYCVGLLTLFIVFKFLYYV